MIHLIQRYSATLMGKMSNPSLAMAFVPPLPCASTVILQRLKEVFVPFTLLYVSSLQKPLRNIYQLFSKNTSLPSVPVPAQCSLFWIVLPGAILVAFKFSTMIPPVTVVSEKKHIFTATVYTSNKKEPSSGNLIFLLPSTGLWQKGRTLILANIIITFEFQLCI